jgi:hypothetical protein
MGKISRVHREVIAGQPSEHRGAGFLRHHPRVPAGALRRLHLERQRLCHRAGAALTRRPAPGSGPRWGDPAVLPASAQRLSGSSTGSGGHPLGYHIVTLLLHIGSAVLFALVLRRLFAGAFAGCRMAGGLLFACTRCTSSRWPGSRSRRTRPRSCSTWPPPSSTWGSTTTGAPGTYAGALALFLCALACKTVTATPARGAPRGALVEKRGRLDWRRDFPAPSVARPGRRGGLFSGWVERHYGGAQGAEFDIPRRRPGARRRPGRVVLPGNARLAIGLNFVYPRWAVDASAWWQWLFPLGASPSAPPSGRCAGAAGRPLAAFLFFVGSLFPALGFVNLYGARYSWVWDHWQYLPDLGPIALGAACIAGMAGWAALPGASRLGRARGGACRPPRRAHLGALRDVPRRRDALPRDDPSASTARPCA